MNCPACGAPMQLKADMESYRCEYCHSVYFPEKDEEGVRVLGEPSAQACPVCGIPLVAAEVAHVRILYCTRCHGMLAPMPALESLIDGMPVKRGSGAAVEVASDMTDLERRLACPRCHHAMDAHFYAGPGRVIVNSCEDCLLLWLDRGGLMRIARATANDAVV